VKLISIASSLASYFEPWIGEPFANGKIVKEKESFSKESFPLTIFPLANDSPICGSKYDARDEVIENQFHSQTDIILVFICMYNMVKICDFFLNWHEIFENDKAITWTAFAVLAVKNDRSKLDAVHCK